MEQLKKDILEKLSYTELVYGRINKKLQLNLDKHAIETLIFDIISNTNEENFQKKGKNINMSNFDKKCSITINSFTYRIITANKI